MSRVDVGDPVADGLAGRLLQRLRTDVDRTNLGAEQLHAFHVGPLAAHVLDTHVDDAVEPEAGTDGGGGDSVLTGARLGDDSLLAKSACQHYLAERVVELVRARVQQVLALEVDALFGTEALGQCERRRTAAVVGQKLVQLACEAIVVERRAPARLQLLERGNQRLGDVAPAVAAVEAAAFCRGVLLGW